MCPRRVRVLRGAGVLDELGTDFDELVRSLGAPVTARRTWLTVWARYAPYEPIVVAIEDDHGLAAVAPLATARRRGTTLVVGMGHGESDRACLPARDADAAAALAEAVVGLAVSWRRPWRLRVEQLPRGDPVARGLVERLSCADLVAGDPCPLLRFDRGRDPGTYEGPSLRKQVRKAQNRLSTDGLQLAIDRNADVATIESSLDELAELHRARDHSLGRRSALDDPAGLGLWRDLMLEHARRGEVELVRLSVDGTLAAYDLALLDGRSYTIWDGRIDSRFGRYFPGHLVGHAQLHAALGHEDIEVLDLGRGAEPYKNAVAGEFEEREDLLGWSSPVSRAMLETPRRARRRVGAFADRHRSLRRAWVWLKRRTVAR